MNGSTPVERTQRLIECILAWPVITNLLLQSDTTEIARVSGAEHELDYYAPRQLLGWGGGVVREGWS